MKWFTIDELCYSATANAKGISNVPTADVKKRLELLVSEVLDPVREAFGKPIIVNSGYRSERLNKAIGGAKKSQHLRGEAVDVRAKNPSDNKVIFDIVAQLGKYDQLIWEHNVKGSYWVHVSYRADGKNRRHVISDLLKK